MYIISAANQLLDSNFSWNLSNISLLTNVTLCSITSFFPNIAFLFLFLPTLCERPWVAGKILIGGRKVSILALKAEKMAVCCACDVFTAVGESEVALYNLCLFFFPISVTKHVIKVKRCAILKQNKKWFFPTFLSLWSYERLQTKIRCFWTSLQLSLTITDSFIFTLLR